MSAEQITKELIRLGHKKATTTVRHHIEVLKKAGLIEIAKIDEARGGIIKYYSPTTRVVDYDAGHGIQNEKEFDKLTDEIASKFMRILKSITRDKRFAIFVGEKKHNLPSSKSDRSKNSREEYDTCTLCTADHLKERAILLVVNGALTKAISSPDFVGIIEKNEPAKIAINKTD